MGPTNLALVNLFKADQQLREAQGRLDAASKDVRIQERRVHDLSEKLKQGQHKARELAGKSHNLDLDLKARDAKIEKYRSQQQSAKNNKEYQAFLVEINTAKVDRNKVEEDAMKLVAQLEAQQKENTETATMVEAESAKLAQLKGSIEAKLAGLREEIEKVRPARDAAAEEVSKLSGKALQVYERLAERYDGEAMAHIARSDPRSEQYVCTSCNMELVIDIYNRLKTRDDLVMCPNCGRMLYIPADMPAVAPASKPKAASTRTTSRKTNAAGTPGAPVDPVKAELNRLLTKAAGESARNAIAAGNTPQEFEVFIEGKFFGTYKGQNIDNFRRTARYNLQEAGVIKEMEVYEKGQSPKPSTEGVGPAAVTGHDVPAEPPSPDVTDTPISPSATPEPPVNDPEPSPSGTA